MRALCVVLSIRTFAAVLALPLGSSDGFALMGQHAAGPVLVLR